MKNKGVEIDSFKEDTMDKLVRIALLGNRKAQEEITERGELLPCWCCGSNAVNYVLDRHCQIKCQECNSAGKHAYSLLKAMKNWNTRPKLVTFCEDCKHCYKGKCMAYDEFVSVSPDGFCSRGEREDNNEKV